MASYEQAKSLLRNSVSRPTLYSLELTGKKVSVSGLRKGLTNLESEYIKLFCDNVEFPGLEYEQVTTIGQEAMGVQRTIAAGMMFGAGNRLRFSVIENSDFGVYDSLRKLFDSACASGGNPLGNSRSQRMNYYNDYKFNTVMRKLEFPNGGNHIPEGKNYDTSAIDHGYKVVATYTFENCYLTAIDPVTYDSNQTNSLLKFISTLRFENYHHDNRKYMYGKELPGYPYEQ